MTLLWIAIVFVIIAAVYASVGFGGGSSYIAILLLAGLAMEEVRFTALVCNIVVVTGSSWNYSKNELIPWQEIWPIVILSVPMAFLGGSMQLAANHYKILVGVVLIIAALLMLNPKAESPPKNLTAPQLAGMGGGIGLLSGLIGIGGGIFLSPLLYIIRWGDAKKISATASVFILINSVAGLTGQLTHVTDINYRQVGILVLSVFIGGQVGNHFNINIWKPKTIKWMTAILVAAVGIRLLLTQINE